MTCCSQHAAAVRALLRCGARVVVGDLSEESFGNDLVNHLKNDGDNGLLSDNNIQFCRVDVTQPETITAALDVIQDVFGIPVNAVVNSAGIATTSKTVNQKGQTSTKAMDELLNNGNQYDWKFSCSMIGHRMHGRNATWPATQF